MSTNVSATPNSTSSVKWARVKRRLSRDWQLYIFVLPGLIYYIVFHYFPLYGIQIAFKDYKAVLGINGSEWVGLEHFKTFFTSYMSWTLIKNTLLLNLYALLWSFPLPIILSLLLNRVGSAKFKKFTQTVIYVPHFVSTVVLAGMLYIFLDPTNGFVNILIFIIIIILLIQSSVAIYKIISKFWRKNNTKIKNIIKKLDKELRIELQ